MNPDVCIRESICAALLANLPMIAIQDVNKEVLMSRAQTVASIFRDMSLVNDQALADCTEVLVSSVNDNPAYVGEPTVAAEFITVMSLVIENKESRSESLVNSVYDAIAKIAQPTAQPTALNTQLSTDLSSSTPLPLTPVPSEAAVDTEGHIKCGAGMYIKSKCKGHEVESCEKCQPGKFNKDDNSQNRRCKKCPKDSFQNEKGASYCLPCPPGFHTRNSRGKKQCFERSSGKSMKKLGYFNEALYSRQ